MYIKSTNFVQSLLNMYRKQTVKIVEIAIANTAERSKIIFLVIIFGNLLLLTTHFVLYLLMMSRKGIPKIVKIERVKHIPPIQTLVRK